MMLNSVFAMALLAVSASPQPVADIDVEQYVGKWYEIAKLPTSNQPDCGDVTADYELLSDGQIGVVNSCQIKFLWFKFRYFIAGKAKAIEGKPGEFELTLRPLSAFIPFGNRYERGFAVRGDYWVLELGDNYEYALVGDPSKTNLFIISRTPVMSQSVIDDLLELAEVKHGYNNAAGRVEFTDQTP